MPVIGPRFLIEAGFIITVAVIAGIARLSTWWIIAVVAGAWIIVAIVEIVVWGRHAAARQADAVEPLEADPAFIAPPTVQVREQPVVEMSREPTPEPETTTWNCGPSTSVRPAAIRMQRFKWAQAPLAYTTRSI